MTTTSGNCTAGYFCSLSSTSATPSSADPFGGPCTAGNYCPAGAVREIPCPPGQYCQGANRDSPNANCSAGYFCLGSATTPTPSNNSTEGGNICPAGYYCPAGSSSPIPCSPGTYRATTGASQFSDCINCDAGSYCSAIGSSAVTGTCNAGFYCPAGSTVANQNICGAGHRCPIGSGSQVACTDPDYQDQKGQSVCKTCAAGYICTQTSRTLCRPDQSSLSFY